MLNIIKHRTLWIVMSLMFASPQSAWACAACSGRSDDTMAQGLNAAVLTMLVVLVMVLGFLGGFMAYLIRRAATHPLASIAVQGGTGRC